MAGGWVRGPVRGGGGGRKVVLPRLLFPRKTPDGPETTAMKLYGAILVKVGDAKVRQSPAYGNI